LCTYTNKVTPGQINVTGDGCGDGISVGTVDGTYEKEEKKRNERGKVGRLVGNRLGP